MSVDEQKTMSRRVLEQWSANNPDSLEDVLADDYVNHQEPDVEGGISTKTLAEWKELVSGFHESFSGAKAVVLRQMAEGDFVASHWQVTATHHRDFRGLKATGREATWTGAQIDRFAGGKIAESWIIWDKYRFFEELGLVG